MYFINHYARIMLPYVFSPEIKFYQLVAFTIMLLCVSNVHTENKTLIPNNTEIESTTTVNMAEGDGSTNESTEKLNSSESKTLISNNTEVNSTTPVNMAVGNGSTVKRNSSDEYRISSKDNREETILSYPIERPYTLVRPDKNRSLYPVRILAGKSPCAYTKFVYFFNEARDREMQPFDLLMNATVTINQRDYYFYDAEDLCIGVDDELNVDMWQYDCDRGGVCVCGLYFGYVDPDIAPHIENRQIKYLQTNGLDRKLVTQNGECRSGFKGHCSVPDGNVSLKTPLKCSTSYECRIDDSYGPVFTNLNTGQVYGICLPKSGMADARSRSLLVNENLSSNTFAPCLSLECIYFWSALLLFCYKLINT